MRHETVRRLAAEQVGVELLARYADALERERRFENKRSHLTKQTHAPPERWLLINGTLPELFEQGDPTGVRGPWPTSAAELGRAVKSYVEQV